MEDNNNFENIIKGQFSLIRNVVANLEFIFEIKEFKKKHSHLLNNRLLRIYRLVLNDTVLSLYKLVEPNQNYGFQKAINIVQSSKKIKCSNIKLAELNELLQEITTLYDKLHISDIRDKYVGHLDKNRKGYKMEDKFLNQIKNKSINLYNSLTSLIDYHEEMFENITDKTLVPILEMTIEYNDLFNEQSERFLKKYNS